MTRIRHTLFIILAVASAIFTQSCNGGHGGAPKEQCDSTLATNIDSAYNVLAGMNGGQLTVAANRLMAALDKEEITDSLIVFAPGDNAAKVRANADYWMGEYLYAESRALEAMPVAEKALREAVELGDSDLATSVNSLLSAIYMRAGMMEDALKAVERCLEKSTASGNKENLSSDLNNAAAIALALKRPDQAKGYIDRAMAIERPLGRNDVMAIRLGLASEVYMALDSLDKAEKFAAEALQLDREGGREGKAAVRLSQYAAVTLKKGDYRTTVDFLEQAIPTLRESGNVYSLSVTENQMGDAYLGLGNKNEARAHYENALEMARANGFKYLQQRALKGLWEALRTADPAAAGDYLEQYAHLSEEMYNESTETKMAAMQARLENSELQHENERLTYRHRMQWMAWSALAVVALAIILVLCYMIYAKNRKNRMLREVDRMRTDFYTDITHELRSPLTAILGLSDDISRGRIADAEGVQRASGAINRQGNALLTLINQMLEIGKIRAKMSQFRWCHSSVSAYVAMIVENYAISAEHKGIALNFASHPEGIEMDFVPDAIDRIVGNLLSNSIKYTDAGGRIDVTMLVDGGMLEIRVADNGRGIAHDDLAHVFEPFYSGRSAGTELSTGIGLSLVYRLVSALEGTIKAESTEGEGTVMTVRLPLASSMARNADTVNTASADEVMSLTDATDKDAVGLGESDREVVLLVDDNADVAEYLATELRAKYDVHIAANGAEGLEMARQLVPDVIVTDVKMPEMDGLEMTRRLRSDSLTDHISIVAVTAHTEAGAIDEGLRAGIDTYIYKPFNADSLEKVVSNTIHRRNRLQAVFVQAPGQTVAAGIAAIKEEEQSLQMHGQQTFVDRYVEAVTCAVNNHEKIDISQLADLFEMSTRQLARKTLAITGKTPSNYINIIKIDMAKRMLDHIDQTGANISEIARNCGFDDAAYFSKIFRQITGMTPREYSKKAN